MNTQDGHQRIHISFNGRILNNQNNLLRTLAIKWDPQKGMNLDKILLQICNIKNGVAFHAFIDCEKAFHDLQLEIHNELSCYNLMIYGLHKQKIKDVTFFRILGVTADTLENLHKNGKINSADGIELTDSLPCSSEVSSCKDFQFRIDCIFPTTYTISDLQPATLSIIIVQQLHTAKSLLFIHETTFGLPFTIPFQLEPATDYTVKLLQIQNREYKPCSFYAVSYFGMMRLSIYKIRSYMDVKMINELYSKARMYIERQSFAITMGPIHFFYRNKSYLYFLDIFVNKQGVMYTYKKNQGGDKASTLNGRLKGLFFSAHLDRRTLLPPNFSHYGPQRFNIPVHCLFNEFTNLYFADFYCHYQNHKAMLVIAIKGSEADIFCRERLLLLDSYDNPFLKIFTCNNTKAILVNLNITVEVFYTEHINIRSCLEAAYPDRAFFDFVEQFGDGKNTVIGIPKNKNCRICNLDHISKLTNNYEKKC